MRHLSLFALLMGSMLMLSPAMLFSDELHKKDGSILYGRLEKASASNIKFRPAGSKSLKSVKIKDIQRLVLTYDLPDFVYNDPRWSKEMVDARKKQTFDPSWGKVEVLKSDHYIVFTNSSAGKRYMKTMEDIYDRFTKIFPFKEPKDAPLLPVFLFKTRDHYNRFYAKIAGISIAAAAQSGGHAWKDYYATYYNAPKDPVHYHEGAHQLVNNRMGLTGGGSWFQEGFAVYFEGCIFPAEDVTLGIKSKVRQKSHVPLGEMMALRSLLYSTGDSLSVNDRYRQAGAIMKFLLDGPYSQSFTAMIDAARRGDPWEDIFREVYGCTVEDMDQAFVDYYKDYQR